MEKKKAKNISTITVGIGIILVLLPAFEVMPDYQDGLLFLGLLCVMGGIFIKMMAE